MKKTKYSRKKPKYGLIVLVLLVVSIVLGFLIDFLWTQIEYKLYPQEYSEFVSVTANDRDVPEYIIYSVIKAESSFDPSAVSHAGAVGLMQLLPSTFEWLTNDMTGEHLEAGMIYDPQTNIEYGAFYLAMLYSRYEDWDKAFAAYNAGSGNVDEWLENEDYTDKDGNLVEIPFKETRDYVEKVNRYMEKYKELYYEDKSS